ncbi:MAG: hypothetical protein ACI867_001511 [Glaciecola sp.]|jgi:hypothetical protein
MNRTPLTRTATVGVAAVLAFGFATVAYAQTDATVTATVTSPVGAGRSVTAVSPVTLASVSGLEMSGVLTVGIDEVAATGINDWSVTVSATALSGTDLTDIPASALAIDNRATVGTGQVGEVTLTDGSGSEDLSVARTLFTVGGEVITGAYSGVFAHTADITLSIPNGAELGAYTGTLTVTIVE